jgi:2'-5' RNA ligase
MRLPPITGDQRRIGVAIAIPEPYGARLQAVRAGLGDPLARFIPPHVTLVGPTVLDAGRLPEVERHIAAVARTHPPFVLQLRGTGSFRPVSPVVFVKLVRGVQRCAALEEAVRTSVLAQDLRFDYHPHVTIAHDLDDATLDRAERGMADFEATFLVDRFSLFEHGDDGVWRSVRDVILAGS